jgi:phage gpG-like protein
LFSAELQRDKPRDYKRMIEQAGQKFAPAAGIIVRGQAAALAPVQTGNLRGSLTWRTNKSDGGFDGGNRSGTMITEPMDDYTVYVGTNVEYAEYVEYGRDVGEGDAAMHVGERAYLRPAIDVNRKRLNKLFGELFREEVGRG